MMKMTHFEESEPTENKQFQRSDISSISLTQVALVGDAVAVLKKVIQITFFLRSHVYTTELQAKTVDEQRRSRTLKKKCMMIQVLKFFV
jgi:hypothetical protein